MTLKDRCKSEELRKRLEIEDVVVVVIKSILGSFGIKLEEKGCERLGISTQKHEYCGNCWKR